MKKIITYKNTFREKEGMHKHKQKNIKKRVGKTS